MKQKCGYADKYKATKEPTCGCRYCIIKWEIKKMEGALMWIDVGKGLRKKYKTRRDGSIVYIDGSPVERKKSPPKLRKK